MDTKQKYMVDDSAGFEQLLKSWEPLILENLPDLVNISLNAETRYSVTIDPRDYQITVLTTLLGRTWIIPPQTEIWNNTRPFEISFSELLSRLRSQVSAYKSREKKKMGIQQKQLAVFGQVAPCWWFRSPEKEKSKVTSMGVRCPRNIGRYDVNISLPNNTDPVKIMILRDRLEELLREVTGQDIKPTK